MSESKDSLREVFNLEDFLDEVPDHAPISEEERAKRDAEAKAEAEARAAREAEKKEEEVRKFNEWCNQAVRSAAPPRLIATNTNHDRFNDRAWRAIQKWTPTDEAPWLGLVGASGKCKSRIALMTAPLILQGIGSGRPTFKFLTGYELAQLATGLYVGDEHARAKTAEKIADAKSATLLLLDDMDKTRFTPNIAEVFFSVIDHRHGRNMRMIWTANTNAEEIGKLMPPQFGDAFAGRLLDTSRIFRLQ